MSNCFDMLRIICDYKRTSAISLEEKLCTHPAFKKTTVCAERLCPRLDVRIKRMEFMRWLKTVSDNCKRAINIDDVIRCKDNGAICGYYVCKDAYEIVNDDAKGCKSIW